MVTIEKRSNGDDLVVVRDGVIIAGVVRREDGSHSLWFYGWVYSAAIQELAALLAEMEPPPAKADGEAAVQGPVQRLGAALERFKADAEEMLRRIEAAQAELERGAQ